jgi:hypothetical protein
VGGDRGVGTGARVRIARAAWWHGVLRNWLSLRRQPLEDQWSRAATPVILPEWLGAQFLRDHPTVADNQLALVQFAFLQWVRIEGRNPGGHTIPSRAVLDMFALLRGDDKQWTAFCQALPLGDHLLTAPREWDVWNAADRHDARALRATWSDAMLDEYRTDNLPTLFWVDEVCCLPGAAQVHPTCVDSPCRSEPPVVCLHFDLSAPWTAGGSGG